MVNSEKKKLSISSIISWIFMIVMITFLGISLVSVFNSKKSGEDRYVFGYRIIYTTSGSMEPTIKTYGSAIAKKVESIDELKKGDIITFKFVQDNGTVAKATHRIYNIDENGYIWTKGDNNKVVDKSPITFKSVESKVCLIMNFTATIYSLLTQGARGRIILICSLSFIVLLFISIRIFIKLRKRRE